MSPAKRKRPSQNKPFPDVAAAAKKLLGFASLRPGQGEAIRSLLRGQDTLVVQPTGYGKSAIYQIAGALLPGATVVVSPLIAL
ncbi:MAG TPA: DEAD/DEAH box helicase, partial [Acidobacteriaceae bacterium]|nr:DEAD/DEAH box helicase [Acidobacteriaceae bacterium]